MLVADLASVLFLAVPEGPPAKHPWYVEHAYHGWFGCVTGEDEARPKSGQRVLVLAADQAPASVRVDRALEKDEWPVTEPGTDEVERGCAGKFQHGEVRWVARLHVPERLAQEVVIALVPPASGFTVIGGQRAKLSDEEAWKLAVSIGATASRVADRSVLAHAYRYGPQGGHEAVELYLGSPTYNPAGQSPPISSIKIRRIVVVDGARVAEEAYSRGSGVEERVDSGIVQLTMDGWSMNQTALTLGFLSRDSGATWDRLSVDAGFEGISWRAHALREGLPLLFEEYLYTTH